MAMLYSSILLFELLIGNPCLEWFSSVSLSGNLQEILGNLKEFFMGLQREAAFLCFEEENNRAVV